MKSKWIPHSKGGPRQKDWEIAVVREDNKHGIESYGWFNDDNKHYVSSSGGPSKIPISHVMWHMLLTVAKQHAEILNKGEE